MDKNKSIKMEKRKYERTPAYYAKKQKEENQIKEQALKLSQKIETKREMVGLLCEKFKKSRRTIEKIIL